MPRLNAIDPKEATGKAKELLDGVKAKIGMVPNLMRAFANSPAALEGYLNFTGIGVATVRAICSRSLALSNPPPSAAEYCLSAHTATGGF